MKPTPAFYIQQRFPEDHRDFQRHTWCKWSDITIKRQINYILIRVNEDPKFLLIEQSQMGCVTLIHKIVVLTERYCINKKK